MKTDILGVGIDSLMMPEAVERGLSLIRERRGAYVCTPNPEMLWLCRKDAALRSIVNRADLVLADGVGDLLGAEILGRPLPERVGGFDFCCGLLERLEGSVFLLGAKPGVAERAGKIIEEKWPHVCVAGVSDGYYSDEEALVARIKDSKPDFVIVCLGMGRQERFMASLAGCSGIGLMAGLGGTLDVLAGDVKRAPDYFIRHKLEWLYRTWHEPKRIKRLMRLPLYVAAVVIQRVSEL